MKKKPKLWVFILVFFLVAGLIGAIADRGKAPQVRVAPVETAAPLASATPNPTATPKPAATPEPTKKPAEQPSSTLEPVAVWTAPPDRSAPAEEPAPTVAPEPQAYNYVLNTKSKKFHWTTCSGVKTMKAENRQDVYMTRDEVIAMGYSPCGTCKP